MPQSYARLFLAKFSIFKESSINTNTILKKIITHDFLYCTYAFIRQLQFNYKSLITKRIQRLISLTRRGFRNKFQGIKKKLKDEKRSKGFIEGLSRCWDENHATVRSVGARSEFRTRRNYDTGGFYRGGSDACGIHVAETRSGSVDVFARK